MMHSPTTIRLCLYDKADMRQMRFARLEKGKFCQTLR